MEICYFLVIKIMFRKKTLFRYYLKKENYSDIIKKGNILIYYLKKNENY